MLHGRRALAPALLTVALVVGLSPAATAEVAKVTVTARAPVAGGEAFGAAGAYEKLTGTIEFALDPSDPHNARIADLGRAPVGPDRRVRFTADLFVLQPVDAAKGNGALLFEIANRGTKGLLQRFNRAPRSNDPTTHADLGDGFLMREGYTLVWVGWQFDVDPPLLRVEAPPVSGPASNRARVSFVVDERRDEVSPADLPRYLPAAAPNPTLTVRDLFWQAPAPIQPNRVSVRTVNGRPMIGLQGGFEPGRVYEIEYSATGARVAGVGLAAIRDAATAFVHRTDLPVHGRQAYVFGISQSGRFLRQFLHDGFNADEQGRRVFDAVWAHIAGAGQGSFNEPWALPGYSSFPATRFPFTDEAQQRPGGGPADGIQAIYSPEQRPRVFYTDTSVEYWGQGRAAALTHMSIDGKTDLALPANVRLYLLAGTQHGEAAFPPPPGPGQQLGNPTPQANVMRALLRALHAWAADGAVPPESRYPRLRDGSLTPVAKVKFPAIPGVGDPRKIEGPADTVNGRVVPLPFLVPQVDADGNEIAGIRVPEQLVPLATTTGWNFRAERIGNPGTIYALLGAYVALPRTRAERTARHDPRKAIEERYAGRDDYLQKIRAAADALVKDRLLLADDLDDVMQRAGKHWDHVTRAAETR
jgi:hypothetical protein